MENLTNEQKVALALQMVEESRKRMETYTPEQKAELEKEARRIISEGKMRDRMLMHQHRKGE
jgi:hypothetical protein